MAVKTRRINREWREDKTIFIPPLLHDSPRFTACNEEIEEKMGELTREAMQYCGDCREISRTTGRRIQVASSSPSRLYETCSHMMQRYLLIADAAARCCVAVRSPSMHTDTAPRPSLTSSTSVFPKGIAVCVCVCSHPINWNPSTIVYMRYQPLDIYQHDILSTVEQ